MLVNATLADLDGVPADVHAGRTPTELGTGMVWTLEPAMRRAVATGAPIRGVEVADDASRSRARRWRGEVHPVRREDGEVSGVAVLLADATWRARAEEELAEAERRMRRSSAERRALRRIAGAHTRGEAACERHLIAAREIALLMGGDVALIVRFESDGARVAGRWAHAAEPDAPSVGELVAVDGDGLEDAIGPISCLVAPIEQPGGTWGAILVGRRRGAFDPDAGRRLDELVELVAVHVAAAEQPAGASAPVAAPVIAPTPGDDLAVLRAVTDAARALLRIDDPRQACAILEAFVLNVGGTVGPPTAADPSALPIDLSLGEHKPLAAYAEPLSMARLHLERALPVLLEDAREAVGRLRGARARGRPPRGEVAAAEPSGDDGVRTRRGD